MNGYRVGVIWLWVGWGLMAPGDAGADPVVEEATQLEAVARAHLEEQLGVYESRRAQAQRQIDRAQSFFLGELSLDGAFPELADRPLGDPAFLLSTQLEHDERIALRSLERLETAPESLSEEDMERWETGRHSALEAEDLADLQSMRLIGGLRAGLDRAPAFREDRIRAAMRAYEEARVELGELDPDDPQLRPRAQTLAQWAESEARALAYRRAALDFMSIPGDEVLHGLVEDDLAAAVLLLDQAEASEDGASLAEDFGLFDRLSWVEDLVPAEQQQAIAAVEDRRVEEKKRQRIIELKEELQAVEAELDGLEDAAPEESQETLSQALNDATSARELLEAEGGSAEDEERQLRLEIAQAREQIAQVRLEAGEAVAKADMEGSATNQEELAEAQARAEEARRLAEEARADDDEPTAALREQVLRFSDQAAEILLVEVGTDEAPGRSPLARQRVATLREDLEAGKMAASAALGMAPLVPGRQEAVDDAWTGLREVVEAVRVEVWDQYQERERILIELETLRDSLPDASEVGGSSQHDALVLEWHEALSALKEVMTKQEENLVIELDGGLQLLSESKAERRKLREKISASRERDIRREFLPELTAELREVPLQFASDTRSWVRFGRDLGTWLMDLSQVGAAFRGFVELFVLIGLWFFMRRPLVGLIEAWTERLQRDRARPDGQRGRFELFLDRSLEHGDYSAAGPLLGKLVVDLLSILVAWFCLEVLQDRLSLLGLVFMVWQVRNCVRAGPRLAALFFVGPGQIWPAWRRVTETQRSLIQRTSWLICVWLSVEWILHGVALDLMDADRLNDLVDIGAMLAWIGLTIRLLARWAADIRRAVERRGNDRFTPVVANAWRLSLLHPLQALAGLAYLVFLFVIRLSVQLLSTRRGLSWLTALVVRTQLKESRESLAPIPQEHRQRLQDGATRDLEMDREIAKIQGHLQDWRESRRRGMVALTGDRGAGKSRFMDRLEVVFGKAHGDEEVLPVRRIGCPTRSMKLPQAMAWLAESLELEIDGSSPEALIEALNVLPPQVIAMDDLHQSFRRSVGGYDGLVALLQVMHATSEGHFWLVSLHEPAWTFLRGVPGAVNLSVFRDRVSIHRLGTRDASEWLESRVAGLGLRLDYEDLVGEVLPGVDRERALTRAKDAFWRLLVQSCQGNPQIILHYWLQALRTHADPDRIQVSLFDARTHTTVQAMGDSSLFVLTALIIHDGLDVEDIGAVLNLSEGESRSLCRQLESQGILRSEDGGSRFEVELSWLPAVERILQQKHFIHAQE